MASTRRSAPADGAGSAAVLDAVRAALARLSARRPGTLRVAVAVSGGRDSTVLLDAASRVAPEHAAGLSAVHVHHGLSPNADAWTTFCAAQCEARRIPLDVRRVAVARDGGSGLEAAARHARYDAIASADADAVLLAHHADDQAETLLLQLLRGAGPHGLAAMPRARVGERATLVRPLLDLPRRAIERYAADHAVQWIDDESNDDRSRTRNFLRHDIAPRLAARFPGYPATLVRAAAHQAEAALLADELAMLDASDAFDGATLDRARLASLAAVAPHRARNVLRWFLRERGLRAPSTARLAAMLDSLARASTDARVEVRHDGVAIGVHRGRVHVHRVSVAPFAVRWHGEAELALPHGTLEFAAASGEGLAAALVRSRPLVVRSRDGGERMRVANGGARQAVKHLLQRAGVPHWARSAVPLVFCGDVLAAVPGIGIDPEFAAGAGAPGYALRWHPGAAIGEA